MSMNSYNLNNLSIPPPVLSMARVVSYATVDESVGFSGRQRLYVDGKLLGKVPKIVICRPLRKNSTADLLIYYCDGNWDVLGVTQAASIVAAEREVERYYPGISRHWIAMAVTEPEAVEWIKMHHKDEICSFCGRLPFEFDAFVAQGSAVICSVCIDEFYGAIHPGS